MAKGAKRSNVVRTADETIRSFTKGSNRIPKAHLQEQLVDAHPLHGISVDFAKQNIKAFQTMVSVDSLVVVHDGEQGRQDQSHVLCQTRGLSHVTNL